MSFWRRSGLFVALMDKNTIVVDETEEYVTQALEKTAGKMNTDMKAKGFAYRTDGPETGCPHGVLG
jgi:hypothetical protein